MGSWTLRYNLHEREAQLIDGTQGRVERLHVDPGLDGVDLEELRQAYATRIEAPRYDHEVIALVEEMLIRTTSVDPLERTQR